MGDIRTSSMGGTPFGDSSSRPSSPQVGQTYYNGTLGYLEIYTATGWIPATGANDLNINLTGLNTVINFPQSYAAGSYSIVSLSNDNTLDIYAYSADGSLAGYTNTKSFIATQRFSKMVILGGSTGDVLSFSYKTTYTTSISTSDTSAGPYITSISPSAMPNQNDTITITGGNFATNVAVSFTGTGYSSTSAKSIVRSSSTQIIVTRPDNFPVSASPYTVTVTNPSVLYQPTSSAVNVLSNSVTAGTSPVWSTNSILPVASHGIQYSKTLIATDEAGSTISYSLISGTLPTGLFLNSNTGVLSGTVSSIAGGSSSIVIRATDSGGNYVDRTFTIQYGPVYRFTFASDSADIGSATLSRTSGVSIYSSGGLDNTPYITCTNVVSGQHADFTLDTSYFSNLELTYSFWTTAASSTNGPNNSIVSLFGGHSSQGGIGVWTTANGSSATVTVANDYSHYDWSLSGTSTYDHIVVVYSRSASGIIGSANTAKVYKNGTLVQTIAGSAGNGMTGNTVGRIIGRADNDNEQGNYKISNLRIYNKVLTESEITALYNLRGN